MMDARPSHDHETDNKDYLGIIFECCRVYSRIRKNKAGDAYVGWCPRCARKIIIPIHPAGTDCRFFKVY